MGLGKAGETPAVRGIGFVSRNRGAAGVRLGSLRIFWVVDVAPTSMGVKYRGGRPAACVFFRVRFAYLCPGEIRNLWKLGSFRIFCLPQVRGGCKLGSFRIIGSWVGRLVVGIGFVSFFWWCGWGLFGIAFGDGD